jgi:hypothetical protein
MVAKGPFYTSKPILYLLIFSHQLLPDSIACRLYVITVLVETTIDLVIEGDLLLRFHKAGDVSSQTGDFSTTSEKMPVFLSIFALAQ